MSTTADQPVDAPPEAVWAVVADPAWHERLDPRTRAVEAVGEPGAVGSGYVVVLRAFPLVRLRLTYRITAAQPGELLVAEVTRRGRWVAEQRAEILPAADGVVLRWTVATRVRPRTRARYAVVALRELRTWLAALAREASTL